jgi:cell division protease FtsH
MARAYRPAWLEDHRIRLPHPIERRSIVGIGHVLTEIDSILARLNHPELILRMGAELPRGILLHGDPGLGKTLIARYVASNLGPDVPMYELSGDELTPPRVRAIFAHLGSLEHRSVLYIDEIDIVGIHRGAWQEQAPATRAILVALLAGLDGLRPTTGPLLIASSNRSPAFLDPALLRPGRLGFHVRFGLPDQGEREALLRLFLERRPVAPDLNLSALAALARGYSPAALRQAVDDATGLALAAGHGTIDQANLVAALRRDGEIQPANGRPDRAGLERQAIHEAGHVAVATVLRGGSWVRRVRITEEGGDTALGDETRPSGTVPADELRDTLVVAFGGLEAEAALLGSASLGAVDDILRATELAHRMGQGGLVGGLAPVWLEALGQHAGVRVPDLHARAVPSLLTEMRQRAGTIVQANGQPIRRFAAALLAAEGYLVEGELDHAIREAGFGLVGGPEDALADGRPPDLDRRADLT